MTIMTMEETISRTFSGEVHLGGPSANPFWNVPLALHSLCGEIEAVQILIRAHLSLQNLRLAENKEATYELGMATMCVVTTSLIAERAIKTLVAQTKPQEKPWSPKLSAQFQGHELSALFRERLNSVDQEAVRNQLETLPIFWNHYAETRTVEDILEVANDNFVDWRYAMEPGGATGGLSKPVLKVAFAFTLVGIERLTRWQAANRISPKRVVG